eukprot:CAMPEP_0184341570 /NCGR_PEP_ID=MMETSP1089-20130417/10167_1 /TAXON_ID=38269 ORGANISM="Gloeochaete wittrockiana, Strain SAG46.84" /NCGR_SAMPLE_ID=MMETSP1089 /ASSEMBLY_ACC=CAM_ASM_000445 /LENGTH=2227 /DNA_ID=CAMNT_0026669925 /DNA_START=70 /DNA_END=6753 /DNA_ORIENTATION=+
MTKTFLFAALLALLCVVPTVTSYGTVFVDNVVPVKDTETYINATISKFVHASTGQVGKINSRNQAGFSVDTPGPIKVDAGNDITLQAAANIRLGTDDPNFSGVTLTAGDASFSSTHMIVDTNTADLTAEGAIGFTSDAEAIVQGKNFNFNAGGDVSLSSSVGNVLLQTTQDSSITSGNFDFQTTGDMLFQSGLGNVAFSAEDVNTNSNALRVNSREDTILSSANSASFSAGAHVRMQSAGSVSLNTQSGFSVSSSLGEVLVRASTSATIQAQDEASFTANNAINIRTNGDSESDIRFNAADNLSFTSQSNDISFTSSKGDFDFISGQDFNFDADSILFDQVKENIELVSSVITLNPGTLTLKTTDRALSVNSFDDVEFVAAQRISTSSTNGPISFISTSDFSIRTPNTVTVSAASDTITIKKDNPAIAGNLNFNGLTSLDFQAKTIQALAGNFRFQLASAAFTATKALNLVTPTAEDSSFVATTSAFIDAARDVQGLAKEFHFDSNGLLTVLPTNSIGFFNSDLSAISFTGASTVLSANSTSADFTGGNIYFSSKNVFLTNTVGGIFYNADNVNLDADQSLVNVNTFSFVASQSVEALVQQDLTFFAKNNLKFFGGSGVLSVTAPDLELEATKIVHQSKKLEFAAITRQDLFSFESASTTHTATDSITFDSHGSLNINTKVLDLSTPQGAKQSILFRGEDNLNIGTTTISIDSTKATNIASSGELFLTSPTQTIETSLTSFVVDGTAFLYARDEFFSDSGNTDITASTLFDAASTTKTVLQTVDTTVVATDDAVLQSSDQINFSATSFSLLGNEVQIASLYNGDIDITASSLSSFSANGMTQFIRLSAATNNVITSSTLTVDSTDIQIETDNNGDLTYTASAKYTLLTANLVNSANHELIYTSQGTTTIETTNLLVSTENAIDITAGSISSLTAGGDISFISNSYTTVTGDTINQALNGNYMVSAGDLLQVEAFGISLTTDVTDAYITIAADDGIVNLNAQDTLSFTTQQIGNPSYTGDIDIFAAGSTITHANSIKITSTGDLGVVGSANPAIYIAAEGERGNIIFHALNGQDSTTAANVVSISADDGYFTARQGPGSFTSNNLQFNANGFNFNSDSSGQIHAVNSVSYFGLNIYHDSASGIQTTVDDGDRYSFQSGNKFITESGGGESTSFTTASGLSLQSAQKTMLHAGTGIQFTSSDSTVVSFTSGDHIYVNSNSKPVSFTLTTDTLTVTNDLFNIQSGGNVQINTVVGDFVATTGTTFSVYAERGSAYITAGDDIDFTAATNIRISAEGDRDVPRDGVHFSGTSIKSTNVNATTSLFARNFVELGSGLYRPSILFNATGSTQTPGFVLESEGDVLLGNDGAFTATANSMQVQTSRQASFIADNELSFVTKSPANGFITIESNTGNVRIKSDSIAQIAATNQLKFLGNSVRLSSGTPLPTGELSFQSTANILSQSQNIQWNAGRAVSNVNDLIWNGRQSLSITGNPNDGGDLTFLSTLGGVRILSGTTIDFRTTGLESDLNLGTQNGDSPSLISTKATNSPINFQSVGPFETYAAFDTTIKSDKSSIAITSGNNAKLNGLLSDITFFAAADIDINAADDVVFTSSKGVRIDVVGDITSSSASLLISAGTDLTFANNDIFDVQAADLFSVQASADVTVQTNVGGGGNIIIQTLDTETPDINNYQINMNLATAPAHSVTGTVGGNFIGAGKAFDFESTGIDPAGGDFGVRFATENGADFVIDTVASTIISATATINVNNVASSADIQFNTTSSTTATAGSLLMQTRNAAGDIKVTSELGNAVLTSTTSTNIASSTVRFQASGSIGSLYPIAAGNAEQSIIFDSKTFVSLTSPKIAATADNFFRMVSPSSINTGGAPSTDVFIGDIGAYSKSSTTSDSVVIIKSTGPDTNVNIDSILLNVGGDFADPIHTRIAATGDATGNFRFKSAKAIKIFSQYNQAYTVYDQKAGIEISTNRNATDADIIIRGSEVRFEAENGMEFATRGSQGTHFVMLTKVGANIYNQLQPNLPVGISIQAHVGKFVANGGDDGDVVVHAGRDLSVLAEGGVKFVGAAISMDVGNAVLQTLDGRFDFNSQIISFSAGGNMDVVADNLLEFTVPSPNGPSATTLLADVISVVSNEQSYTVSGGNILFQGNVDLTNSALLVPSYGLLVRSGITQCHREGQIMYNAATVDPTTADTLVAEISRSYPRLCRCSSFVWNCIDFLNLNV